MGFFVLHIAQYQGCFFLPAGYPHRGQVRHEMKITVAQLPVGKVIAGHGLHFHVGGEQVVAAMRAAFGTGFQEKLCVKPFSHQTAIMVGKGNNDRFDGFV